jgi:hypothetical protein
MHDTRTWPSALAHAAASVPEEVALAAHARLGRAPEPDELLDLLTFTAVEWVDAEGFTQLERMVRAGTLPEAALPWTWEVRSGLWVVDGWDDERLVLRDARTDDTLRVRAPELRDQLLPRAIVRGRVVPGDGAWIFLGEPDAWAPMGVIARMDLLRRWQETPEPALIERLASLRSAFRRQREERAAWLAHFGDDLVVFRDATDLEQRLARFVNVLLNETRFPSLQGRTRAEAHTEARGDEPAVVQFSVGSTLRGPGRPGVIFDEVEGVHFLPQLGEVLDHLRGAGQHPEAVRSYLEEPGITQLPFRRAGATQALAQLLGRPDGPLETLLERIKPAPTRVGPSVLPGFDD